MFIRIVQITKPSIQPGDYNSLGIPKVPSNKKSPPARPGPPVRPPLPKSPKHTPKAGVISVIPQSLPHDGNQRSLPAPPSGNEYATATSAHSTPSPHSSPTNEPNAIPPSLPPTQEASIKESSASNAIYEEINDDVVSRNRYIRADPPRLSMSTYHSISSPFQYIPKPREPPPPLPSQEALYDLDVNAKPNVSSPSRSVVTRAAPSPPVARAATANIGTPPPLPSRRQPPPPKAAAEPPKIPQRTGTGPPPLPARPNTQL